MNVIYKPIGRAREYSPLALNVYSGCDHNCTYCYYLSLKSAIFTNKPAVRNDFRKRLEADLMHNSIQQQVLLGIAGDPYCQANGFFEETRHALLLLHTYHVPVAILTKGGRRCFADLDIFTQMEQVKVGMRMSFVNGIRSHTYEPGAYSPLGRIEALKTLKAEGIRTWVCIEPVVDPEEALQVIEVTCKYADEYRIGGMNHVNVTSSYDKHEFVGKAVELLRRYGKAFYIAKEFQKYAIGLTYQEMNHDHLALRYETVQENMF